MGTVGICPHQYLQTSRVFGMPQSEDCIVLPHFYHIGQIMPTIPELTSGPHRYIPVGYLQVLDPNQNFKTLPPGLGYVR